MNRTLSDLRLSVLNDVNHLQKYETCREQSKCYLLAPPPRPPTIPELFLTSSTCQLSSANSPSILGNLRPRSDSSNLTIISIVVGLLIAMTSTCLILFLFGVKFRFYKKLRSCQRRSADITSVNSSIRETNNSDVAFIKTATTNTTTNTGDAASRNSADGSTSFSNIPAIPYECLTPLTSTTLVHNVYPSFRTNDQTMSSLNRMNSRQNLTSDESPSSHRNSINIYEEIRPPIEHPSCYCCCSCTMNHYQRQCLQTTRQLTPHYYTCEPQNHSSSSAVVCQSCLLETLHRKQQNTTTMNLACRHFFVPIK